MPGISHRWATILKLEIGCLKPPMQFPIAMFEVCRCPMPPRRCGIVCRLYAKSYSGMVGDDATTGGLITATVAGNSSDQISLKISQAVNL